MQFDLFPSNLLDNIVTLKTFTPDKPGNFSGGLVDIGTKAFPDDFSIKFSASSAYNTETYGDADYLTVPGGSITGLAEGDGFALPDVLEDPPAGFEIPSRAPTSQDMRSEEAAEVYDLFSQGTLSDDIAPVSGTAPIKQSYSLSLGNRQQLFGNDLGYIASATYGRSASAYDGGFTGRYSSAGAALTPDKLLSDTRSSEEASLSGMANVTYRLGAANEIGFNTLYTRSAEAEARFHADLEVTHIAA